MKKIIMAIFIGIILSIIDIICFSLTKTIFINKDINRLWLSLPFILYGGQILLFFYGLNNASMGELNIIWNIVSSIVVAIVGVYLYMEEFNNIKIIALLLGLVSIFLFYLADDT
jgi:drug/metabolite transporter (DMT)-like permease